MRIPIDLTFKLMTIIDRYLSLLFIKIFVVCFVSFTGLFIVIHLFSNLDELAAMAQTRGWPGLMWEFYGPRIAEVFDKTAAVLALVAAVFAVSLMQRRREMTAVEAAGVTKLRILRSVIIVSFVIAGISIANREWVLPRVKDQLVRTAQNWESQDKIAVGVIHDLETGMKIRGEELSLTDHRIKNVEIQLPAELSLTTLSQTVGRIQASSAMIVPADANHAAGLWLRGVVHPANPAELTSLVDAEEAVIIHWPRDTTWLQADQCFVVCSYDAYQAAYGRKLSEYQSVSEMLVELRKPRPWFGNGSQIKIHSRILRPLLDMTLLFLGLPLTISRTHRNVFISAGVCFLIVGLIQLTIIGCHSLGEYSLIEPAALAAWLPAILFTPLAIVALTRIDR